MKLKTTTFRLRLQKSNIANLTQLHVLNGGQEQDTGRTTDVDSIPKTLPNALHDMCQSTDPFNC